ncbi:hypothetical protein D770_04570 [Flammeovirgaceae bacterium 311]|nr:hypothetical protein D770_04570 [Flammeovirgaceae bacterium 311]
MSFAICSCDTDDLRGCPRDYYFDGDNDLGFEVVDEMGANVYGSYDLEIVKETPSGNETMYIPENGAFIYLSFIDSQTDKDVVDQLISKRFYLVHRGVVKDTLDVNFEMRIDRCDDQIMKYLKISFNDSVYYDTQTNRVPTFRFVSN